MEEVAGGRQEVEGSMENDHLADIDLAAVREAIARSRPEDYDGHTEFARLSPAQRLDWLDAAVTLIEASRRNLKNAQGAYEK